MTQYLYPGVYVEEVTPLARPITGVGTSTAGFIGVVMDDVQMPLKPGKKEDDVTGHFTVSPAGEPQLITGWEQFKNNFGDFQPTKKQKSLTAEKEPEKEPVEEPAEEPENEGSAGWSDDDYKAYLQLQHAVYGFFNNGGTRCWVIRVATGGSLTNLADLLNKFEPIDDIAIVAVPGAITTAQQDAIIGHCVNMKDRVAVLDGIQSPSTFTVDGIKGDTHTSEYAALYFPWIKVLDPISQTNISQPPSGHLAGVYARVDAERGVFKAPANEIVLGAVDLDYKLSPNDQAGLNPKGVNVIRAFDGNFNIWGARTLGGDDNGEFKYISTRRYFNFLRKSIEQGTQFVVFEPNSPALWQRITRTVSDFLLRQWRDGALFGDTPKQAFFVKCDKDTNPPEVREAGQVVTEIGVAIVKPAEFVIFRIQQTTGE
ncbi:phage tail protein [Methanosarcina spelaei]|uniref:Phage tail protein n=1 Tax=Methanosarcina spelaei TaxID=1036679 RepID=A0A2A2HUS7_9EURY|nr:phage tail sheath subtilisin-like domain-containing protein [Methanosarcina spelaei]PAV12984.1 phage tail protein [Methanosarcina spelaei]